MSQAAKSQEIDGFLATWHRMVARRDHGALPALLADDVSMGAPPYWERFEGRDVVEHLLGLILQTIESFTYHREWQTGRELALEFTGHVGSVELQGIDLITLDADFRVCRLDVLIRPANAVEALIGVVRPQMTAFFARQQAPFSRS